MPPKKKRNARDPELDKLVTLKARIPYVSQSALSAILRLAQTEALPDVRDRRDLRNARDNHVRVSTPFGPLHQRMALSGGITTEVQHPLAMLYKACADSEQFSALVSRTYDKFPCTPSRPWRICVYTDEVTPGNQLHVWV